MSGVIYSELVEDYFLTNIKCDLFGDDESGDVEADTVTLGKAVLFSICFAQYVFSHRVPYHGRRWSPC